MRSLLLAFVSWLVCAAFAFADEGAKLKILFLGDNGHHQPNLRFRQIEPILASRGITLTYADSADVLKAEVLNKYDGLLIYSNLVKITEDQEAALLDYVASGKGFIPVHCASYCFLNSEKYIDLVGAQFKSHGTGTFRTQVANVKHPILEGYSPFESWDETYVHTKHNERDRIVLEYRIEKKAKEPWTWVRTHGKGKVFYTAWGHDERTWGSAGFQNLLERGIRWAVGASLTNVASVRDRPEMTTVAKDVEPFKYVNAKLPFYPPGPNSGISGKATTQMQLPLDAKESMKHIVHPTDFELKLFATDPMIKRPICMAWDERGRLWIVESVDYPNELKKPGEGRDRILILEDETGEGKATKVTVFADKLSIPTSLAFHNGGVIVHQAPDTLFMKDTDGDGKADVRQVLFTGWNTGDTHAGPSNLQWGLDNHLYGIVGYSGFRGTIGGEKHDFRTGFYRMKFNTPCCSDDGKDDVKFEFLRNTNNNSWGVGISEEGIVFGSTANGNPSVYMPIANRYYEQVRGWSSRVLGGIAGNAPMYPITEKVRQVDWHGHHTAAAGHALYTARNYPKDYWNRTAFVCEPTGHVVSTFVLQGQGADFKSRNAWNLLAANDEWVAPIVAEVGPDGNVWVIDWYNYIVQHNPTPPGFKTGKGNAYETELRDKTHGRIYRLVAKQGKTPAIFTLKDATPETLVATLKNDNLFWRRHAQRLLVERGKLDVVPALVELVKDKSVDAIGLNPGAMHAIWTLHGLGAFEGKQPEALTALFLSLNHPSAGVRRNAVLALPNSPASAAAIIAHNTASDRDPQVRLAAILRIAELQANQTLCDTLSLAFRTPENWNDSWLPDALTAAAARHDVYFLREIAKTKEELSPRALASLRIAAEHFARGGPVDIADATLMALDPQSKSVSEALLEGLATGWPKQKPAKLLPETENELAKKLSSFSGPARGSLLRLAMAWQSPIFAKELTKVRDAMIGTVRDEKKAEQERLEAARQVVELAGSDGKVVEILLDTLTPRSSPEFSTGILESLGTSTAPELASSLIGRLQTLTPRAKSSALRVLLGRPDSTRQFLAAVEKSTASLADLSLDQKQALNDHPDRKIAGLAKKLLAAGGGLPSADRQKVIESVLPLVSEKTGDVAKGKDLFKKHCMTCHSHSGEGAKVGPDLTGVAVHSREHLLIDILDPSRNVEGNFRVYTVTTDDGRIFSGLLASETKTSVELFDAQAKKTVILRENIEQMVGSTKSIMPEGFEKQMNTEEIVHLLTFLKQPGKYLPLPLNKVATIVSTKGMFFKEESPIERMVFKDWSPKVFKGVPFVLVDPQGDRVPNAVLLKGPNGMIAPKMPKSVRMDCNLPTKSVHLLSGVSGWGYPVGEKGTTSMIVRFHYKDGSTEDHSLINGVHFADYIRRVDVPGSEFAYALRGQQIRYLSVSPKREEVITAIEFLSGGDQSAPIVMAVTVETR